MIVITQIDKIDKDILDPVFCRAIWEKKSKKVMFCLSKHHEPRTFYNLPDSPIRFDPDRLAEFVEDEVNMDLLKNMDLEDKDRLYQIIHAYATQDSYRKIMKRLGGHPEEIRRSIRKVLLWYLQNVWKYPEAKRPKIRDYRKTPHSAVNP